MWIGRPHSWRERLQSRDQFLLMSVVAVVVALSASVSCWETLGHTRYLALDCIPSPPPGQMAKPNSNDCPGMMSGICFECWAGLWTQSQSHRASAGCTRTIHGIQADFPSSLSLNTVQEKLSMLISHEDGRRGWMIVCSISAGVCWCLSEWQISELVDSLASRSSESPPYPLFSLTAEEKCQTECTSNSIVPGPATALPATDTTSSANRQASWLIGAEIQHKCLMKR